MGLLSDAAAVWAALQNKEYIFHVAKKGSVDTVRLSFSDFDFPHIAGMQYANDVDFGIRKSEFYGSRLVSAVLSGRIDDKKIEKSKNWDKISGRLNAVINLQYILENDFTIARFSNSKVRGYSKINAKYVVKSKITDDIYFIFFDDRTGRYYCKSAFKKDVTDYFENQTVVTVLYKAKSENGTVQTLYKKNGYQPDMNSPK